MNRLLITTTSFLDTAGGHHALLDGLPGEKINRRGPLTESELKPALEGVEAVICGDDHFTRRILTGCAGRLRVLSKYGTGLDKIDLQAAKDLGIAVYNTPAVNHRTVAEHVMAYVLAVAKNLFLHTVNLREGQWSRFAGSDLAGATMAVVGVGKVGGEVCKLAAAFGMRVHGYDPMRKDWDELPGVSVFSTPVEAIAEADYISLNMPATPTTTGMINVGLLAHCRRQPVVVNCARGEIIDEVGLIVALDQGLIAAYCADVFPIEPLPVEHPFRSHEKIFLSPHCASRTRENVVRQAVCALSNLKSFLAGETSPNRVV